MAIDHEAEDQAAEQQGAEEQEAEIPQEAVQASSARPPDWPGIPGRSAERDRHPPHERQGQGADDEEDEEDAEVTKAQRKLEQPSRH